MEESSYHRESSPSTLKAKRVEATDEEELSFEAKRFLFSVKGLHSHDSRSFDRKGQNQHLLHHSLVGYTNTAHGTLQSNKQLKEQNYASANMCTMHQPSQKPRKPPVPAPRTSIKKMQSNDREENRTPTTHFRQQPQGNYPRGSQHGEGAFYENQPIVRHAQQPYGNFSYSRPYDYRTPCENPPDDHQYFHEQNRPTPPAADRGYYYPFHSTDTILYEGPNRYGQKEVERQARPQGREHGEDHVYSRQIYNSQRPSVHTEDTATVEVSGINPDTSADMLRMYFENNRKSGGGEIGELILDEGVAIITFQDPAAARNVTQKRSHTLQGFTLSVIPGKKNAPQRPSNVFTEENATVVVSGINPNTSADMLRMYFENQRKSGGGEIDELCLDEGVADITFHDPQAARRVTQKKSHMLQGFTLSVIPGKGTASRAARPYDPCRLYLTRIPEGVTSEYLDNFLDGRTGKNEEPDIMYGEDPGTALVTYPTQFEDIDFVIQNFTQKKLQGSFVKASRVQVADSILVQNLKPGSSKESIELYFESTKNSGGDCVRKVRLVDDKNQAVVSFEDWKVVEQVTRRKHKLEGVNLKVTPFFNFLGSDASTDGPTPRVPKPEVMDIDPSIAEYIFNESQIQSQFRQKMQDVATKFEWPLEHQKDKIKLLPDTSLNKDQLKWKSWKETAMVQLKAFFDQFETREIRLSPFWGEIREHLTHKDFQLVRTILRPNEEIIVLQGKSENVKRAESNILNQKKDLAGKAEMEKQSVTQKLPLNSENFKLLVLCRIKEDIEKRWPKVKFTLNTSSNNIECEGMKIEVMEAQLEISNQLNNLSKRSIEVSLCKSRFVSHVEDKIHEVFNARNVHAACNSGGCKIVVTGRTDTDRDRAITYIEKEIVEKRVKVENQSTVSIMQSKKGQDQFKKINSRKVVHVGLNSNNTHVEIAGFITDVDSAVGKVKEFIEENVIFEDTVKAKKGEMRFILEHKEKELDSISANKRQHSLTIKHQMARRRCLFLVSGTQQGVTLAKERLEGMFRNIVYQQYPIAKAGIPQLLRESKGRVFLNTVEKECDCIIDTGEEFDSFEDDSMGDASSRKAQILRRHKLPGGCLLMVCKGDLTLEQVDVIVNAANTDLQHTGGLAKAIVDAGGEIIQTESYGIIRKKGRSLNTGEVVATSPGRLPCKRVFHVAGPIWKSSTRIPKPGDDPTKEENLLWDAVTNVLREANRRQIQTLSIPAISSGIYRFPNRLCAKILVEASIDFCKKNKSCSLKEIRFTNNNDSTCNAFQTRFQEEFGDDGDVESIRSSESDSEVTPNPCERQSLQCQELHALKENATDDDFMGGAYGYSGDISRTRDVSSSISSLPKRAGNYTLTTAENKTISLKKANLAAEKVDAIVNTISGNVDLTFGGVSAALLSAAGHRLQQECDIELAQQGLSQLGIGGILQTGPAALGCRTVYHTVCCSYSGVKSESILCTIMMNILQAANTASIRSIAFPAIGTGNLGFPRNTAAKLMYETVIKFSKKNPRGSLVDILFVLFHKDTPTIQAFEAELQRQTGPGNQTGIEDVEESSPRRRLKKSTKESASSGKKSYEGVRKSQSGTLEMKIGQIRVQVCSGDLTKESTEAIVNSVGRGLDLNGPVSQAIIRAGGNSIARECQKLRDKGDVVKTGAGTLNFNIIIHVVTPRNLSKLKEVVGKALQLAEKERCKSIAFPALGTGNIGGDPAKTAGHLLDAIGEFAASGKAKHLLLIKLTIFQPALMKVFQDKMKSKEGDVYDAQKSLLQRGADFAKWVISKASLPEEEEVSNFEKLSSKSRVSADVDTPNDSIILHIYAGQRHDLQNAKMRIDTYIEEEFARDEMVYDSEVWGELDGRKIEKITKIAKQNSVNIEPILDGKAKRIVIEGRKVDVITTKADMHKYFNEIHLEKKRELEDQLTNKEVEWRYMDPATGQLIKYGDEINPLIERAYQEDKASTNLDLEDGDVRIDFKRMEEVDGVGQKTDIERVDLMKVVSSGIMLPQNWIPMNPGQNSQIVPLLQTTQEYADIESIFKASIGRPVKIIQIFRIQIEDLYKQYTAKKEKMTASAKVGTQVERYAYHGTAAEICDVISKNGFNRSFNGKNGTLYGKGTYFARDASYSDDYAGLPGLSSNRHMFYCKLLTGEYTLGKPTMIAPPTKPNNPTELYDSVVDRHPHPSIFVIFHDTQAYPEYLIIYQ